jgi:hypothetical protein
MLIEEIIMKVHIRHELSMIAHLDPAVGVVRTIGKSASGKLFELHYILSQSSSLVGENVVDLSKFFIQVT